MLWVKSAGHRLTGGFPRRACLPHAPAGFPESLLGCDLDAPLPSTEYMGMLKTTEQLRRKSFTIRLVGAWLSLVEHLVRDQGVGGSNPLAPTNLSQSFEEDNGGCTARLFALAFSLCPELCPLSRSSAARTASSLGWTYRAEIATELCPAMRASVQASQADSPSLVRNV
jgi:hypothetical protein